MNTNEKVIKTFNEWLQNNGKTKKWLAEEMGVDRTLISKILTGERPLTPQRMTQMAEIIGINLAALLKETKSGNTELIYSLRGHFSNRKSQSEFDKMLYSIKSFAKLRSQLSNGDKR